MAISDEGITYDRETVLPALEGMKTKADKIRALAQAGYSRKEIDGIVGISYQHAHHVLKRSGMLRDVVIEREPLVEQIAVEEEQQHRPTATAYLLDRGFRLIGETTQRVSSVWYASRELKISEATIRKIFKRRGLEIPKLDKGKLKAACMVGGAKRRARTQAARQPVSVYVKPVQMRLFG